LWNEESVDKYIVDPLSQIDLEDKNAISKCVWEGMRKGLVCYSGKEIMRLLLQSDRTAIDCKRELDRGEDYDMNLIIRGWVDVPIDFELRCFFTHRKINAISQYFDNCYFQDLLDNKEKIETLVLEKWDEVKDKLPFEYGIVDFTVDVRGGRAYIIEFNPLDMFTGSSLFDYYADWEVIVGAKGEGEEGEAKRPEFRVIETVDNKKLQNDLDGTVSSFMTEIRKARRKITERESKKEEERKEEACSMM
jgi:hypothetical protein